MRAVRAPAPSAADRLSRLLALVPWLLAHQGVPLAEAARRFAITEAQLVRDLELLFVCGTPGHLPDDLIEAEWDSGRVYLANAGAIARPLRLSMDEALALLAGLRTLADVPEALVGAGSGPAAGSGGGRDDLAGALAKLSEAAGESVALARAVRVDLTADLGGGAAPGVVARPAAPDDGPPPDAQRATASLVAAREALRTHRRVHLRYLVPARDETTERDVDPMRLLAVDGHWYLEAWCHRSEGVRLFRLDRVLEATVLAADGTPPPEAEQRDVDDGLFQPSPDDLVVTLDLAPEAAWVAEHYPVTEVVPLGGGRQRVRLRTADPRWVPRLVLALGGAAAVVSPPELAGAVREVAARALAAYGPGGSAATTGPADGEVPPAEASSPTG